MKKINVDCTTVGPRIKFVPPNISIPKDIYAVLKNGLINNDIRRTDYNRYIKCIKSLSNLETLSLSNLEPQNYLIIFKLCLYLEQYASDKKFKECCLRNHRIEQGTEPNCFTIPLPYYLRKNRDLKYVNIVIIHDVETNKRFVGTILSINERNISICVFSPEMSEMAGTRKRFHIYFKYNDWCIRCCHYALSLTHRYDLVEMLFPQLQETCISPNYDIEWVNVNISKNREQKQAVVNILNRSAYPAPYILFGPPGTGKTQTLVETICQIVKQHPTKNILVCAASNAAADEIATRLMKNISHNIIYRMYAPSRELDDVNDMIIPCTSFIGDMYVVLPKEILLLKKIIIATLITSIRLTAMKFRENHFSYIIIDEGSQAIEPEMLIPFTLSSGDDKNYKARVQAQIVIAGDPYQLGPCVENKFIECILGKSMLERLMNNCDLYKKQNGKYNPNYITKLLKNYRSHKHLLHIPNEQFYHNELEACGGPDTEIALNWSKLPNKKFPLIFQEVLGKEERTSNRSVYNWAEILVVIQYVKILMSTKFGNHRIKQTDIGIISFFKEQQIKIMDQLAAINLNKIVVGTVEIFQGQEKMIMILSTTRSKIYEHNDKNHLGFLSNPKRFNVATTRAKALMIIIGNPNIICTDKYWDTLWKYCKENGACIPNEKRPIPAPMTANFQKAYQANPNKIVNNKTKKNNKKKENDNKSFN